MARAGSGDSPHALPQGDARGRLSDELPFGVLALLAVLTLYMGALLLAARGPLGDGYDGVGFTLAVDAFDLARFQPHPPGYPLFVLLGRLLHAAGLPAGLALATGSALLLGAGLAAVAGMLRRVSVAAGWLALLLVPPLPLCFGLGMATLSDGAGLGVLLVAAAVLVRPQADRRAQLVAGVLLGLALGLRPAMLPLVGIVLALGALGMGRRALFLTGLSTALTTLTWLLPLSLYVGPALLWKLSTAHAHGHFTDFGGSALQDFSLLTRLWAFLDGLREATHGPALPLAGGLVVAALALHRPAAWPRRARRLGLALLAFLALASAWTLLALPVRGHGRHLLPIAVALVVQVALVLGTALDALFLRRRRAALLLSLGCALLVGLSGFFGARAAWAFRSQPSPGLALAAYVDQHFPRDTRLYGARAARYLDLIWGSGSARPAVYLGEVIVDLERQPRLPAEVLVTSEVLSSVASQSRLRPLARFCFDPAVPRALRLDSFDLAPAAPGAHLPAGCVELRAYSVMP